MVDRRFSFGERVIATARVETSYTIYFVPLSRKWEVIHVPEEKSGADRKQIVRYEFDRPVRGIVIGRTFRRTGWRWSGSVGYSPIFVPDRQFYVWVIAVDMNTVIESLNGDVTKELTDE